MESVRGPLCRLDLVQLRAVVRVPKRKSFQQRWLTFGTSSPLSSSRESLLGSSSPKPLPYRTFHTHTARMSDDNETTLLARLIANKPPQPVKWMATCLCSDVRFHVCGHPHSSFISEDPILCKMHGSPAQWIVSFPHSAIGFEECHQSIRTYSHVVQNQFAGLSVQSRLQCNNCGTWIGYLSSNKFFTFPSLFDFGENNDRDTNHLSPSHRVVAHTIPSTMENLPCFKADGCTPCSPSDTLSFIAPPLDGRGAKGDAGRICVLGGSPDYTGAPYYAGMAALRAGSELLYICTAQEALAPIKGYSPELMVSEVYKGSKIASLDELEQQKEQDHMVDVVLKTASRTHAIVIGPGLGRHHAVLEAVGRILISCRTQNLPCVIDADGLWLVTQNPDLVKGYKRCVLTPNHREFKRLCDAVFVDHKHPNPSVEELTKALDGPIVLQKGSIDKVCGIINSKAVTLECSTSGAPRRPGGLGDFLAGTLGTMVAWSIPGTEKFGDTGADTETRLLLHSCITACTLVRTAANMAYKQSKRGMVAPDVLECLPVAMEQICPAPTA